jgi:Pretoxin HINT domain
VVGNVGQLGKSCFVAGTPLLTPEGSKAIEEFVPGDLVLSRDEFDSSGEVQVKRVLQKFVRVSPILNLHVQGRIIGTTAEHPFYVNGKGWLAAHYLANGDELQTNDGRSVKVEGIAPSGRVETVYNVEVEGCHTYFVGGKDWDFSVWAHNAGPNYEGTVGRLTNDAFTEANGVSIKGKVPPGNVSADEAYVYSLTRDGEPIHYGTSNDPARRLGEHITNFGPNVEMEVLSGPHLEPIAVQIQNQLIDAYEALNGVRPIGNRIRN